MSENRSASSVVLANVAEFYEPLVRQLDSVSRSGWDAACARTASLAVMWGGDSKLVITPHVLDPIFVRDINEIAGAQHVTCVAPRDRSGLSNAVARDTAIFADVRALLREGSTLRAWAWTPSLCALRDLLQTAEHPVASEFSRADALWVAAYLDSKSGFRDAIMRDPELRVLLDMPEGWICTDIETAAGAASAWIDAARGAVVKADGGAGGIGTVVLPPSVPSDRVPHLLRVAARLCPPLAAGPIVVEEMVKRRQRSARPVSVCGSIESSGVLISGHASLVVTASGRYLGASVGRGVLDNQLRTRLSMIASRVGSLACDLGYSGPFGIDALVDDDERLRCIELNARRTLVTHLYDVAAALLGSNWWDHIALASADRVVVEHAANSYERVRHRLEEIWYPIGSRRRGVFVSSIAPPSPHGLQDVGLVAVGGNAEDASALLRQAHRELGASMPPEMERAFSGSDT